MRKLFTPVLEINQQPDNILDFGEIRVDMNVCVKWANYIVSHRSQAPILKWYRGRLCDIRKYGIIVQRVGNISYCDETSPARSVWLCLYLQGSYPPPLFSYCSAGLLSLIPRSSITVVLRLQFLHSIPLKIFLWSQTNFFDPITEYIFLTSPFTVWTFRDVQSSATQCPTFTTLYSNQLVLKSFRRTAFNSCS